MNFTILSYNVSQCVKMQKLVEEYISQKHNTIVFLQEAIISELGMNSNYSYKKLTPSYSKGTVILLSSNLSSTGFLVADDSRFQILSIFGKKLVNVHMPPRSTNPNRDFEYKKIVDYVKAIVCEEEAIIGGDFNENPFDRLMTAPGAWYAKRSKKEITANKSLGFINPFWNLLRCCYNKEPQGSIKASYKESMKRAIFDQFIMSPVWGNRILSFGIRKNMSKKDIESYYDSIPTKEKVGLPHLPIYITLKIKE